MVSGIEPCKSPSEGLNVERTPSEVFVVDARYLDLAPCGGLNVLCDLNDVIVIEVKTRNRII